MPRVHDPDALGQPVAGFHRLDDLLDGGDVGAIAREDFIAERHPLARDHQGQADLLAVGAVVPAVAPLRQGILGRLPFEVDAGHVVGQQIVVEGEELPPPGDQMLLEGGLVRQQAIEGAVEAIIVDQRGRPGEQVLERRAPIPVLGDVELARGLAQ
ncbi:MAG TPA: hypothetical protein VGQ24_04050, partial [Gemmatimonadales bacterium]|nr:hypothetical protein [Gemmatimonadales bacterium]